MPALVHPLDDATNLAHHLGADPVAGQHQHGTVGSHFWFFLLQGVIPGLDPGIFFRSARDARPGMSRSEERRVGQECVSTCRSRWSPYDSKKTTSQTRTTSSYVH